MVKSGSFSMCPVRMSTTDSLRLMKPCFTNFFNPASVTADAGSQPTPSAPISALASAISTSLTCSTVPPVASRTRTAFFHEAGLPMRMAVSMVSARIGESFFPPFSRMARTSGFAPSANDGNFWQSRNQAEFFHFHARLSDCRGISQVATRNDDVVRRLPVELLEQLNGSGLLALQSIWVNRVQKTHRHALHNFIQYAHTAVKIGFQLACDRAVVERLGEFAPGDLAFRNQHHAAHTSPRCICCHGSRGISRGSASNPAKPFQPGESGSYSHSGVFEGAGGIHALVLGKQPFHSSDASTLRKLVHRRVALG